MSVDLPILKEHLRVRSASEDALISKYLDAATAWVERFIGQRLSPGTVVDTFAGFGDALQLSTGPNATITLTSIGYVDANGDAQTMAVDTARLRDGAIYPPDAGWPAAVDYSTVTVTYMAGFPATPAELEQAQMLLACYFYENRGIAAPLDDSPTGCALNALCRPFRKPTLR